MPVRRERWIAQPLSVIQELFEQSGGSAGSSEVREFFAAKLSGDEALAKVPLLNDHPVGGLPSGSLVRYRCMVQDDLGPELCLRAYTATHAHSGHKMRCCGLYRDLLTHTADYEVDYTGADCVHEDRQTFYCVPIPAETAWAKAAFSSRHCDSPVGDKEGEGEEEEEEGEEEAEKQGQSSGGRLSKRRLSNGVVEGEDEMEVEGEGEGEGERATEEAAGKRQRRDERQNGGAKGSSEAFPELNFPLPWETGRPCLVKVYGDSLQFKVTATLDCVGVLSAEPALAHFDCEGVESEGVESEGVTVDPFASEMAAERKAHSPPPSLAPRLHCILATVLPHSHPLLPSSLPVPLPPSALPSPALDFQRSRESVLDVLSVALLGDRLAAEYVLLHLLSSVYGHTDILALGKFSLNLSCCPPPSSPSSSSSSFPSTLYSVFELLLPKCTLLPLSLSNLNSLRFTPKKDYSANRLLAGLLQLSSGTHLVVDEMAMAPGKLEEKGVNNLTALGNLVQWQKLSYDFQFHTMEFECDVPILILSEGKSIISVDCLLPLCPSGSHSLDTVPGFLASLPAETVAEVRRYLGFARVLHYQLPADTRKRLEEDFVAMRRSDSHMSADAFHQLLTLARLVALSNGCCELSQDQWVHAKQLEADRAMRVTGK